MSIEEKVKYVKSQGQTREHTCHWPKCDISGHINPTSESDTLKRFLKDLGF